VLWCKNGIYWFDFKDCWILIIIRRIIDDRIAFFVKREKRSSLLSKCKYKVIAKRKLE